jgi:hypothetical protein
MPTYNLCVDGKQVLAKYGRYGEEWAAALPVYYPVRGACRSVNSCLVGVGEGNHIANLISILLSTAAERSHIGAIFFFRLGWGEPAPP